jgi:hypothetical protein
MNLVRRFFDFDPQSTWTTVREDGLPCFGNTNQLGRFVKQVDGSKQSTGAILSVRLLRNHAHKSLTADAEKLGKQESKEKKKKKLETSEDGLEDLGGLFSSPIQALVPSRTVA